MAFNLYILRQASKRSWRINQTAPRIEVYLLYYIDTIQQKNLKLMANKLAAATMIEGGGFSEEGLAAMSDYQDLTAQLAKEIVEGIRDNETDLAGTFRSMAVLHQDAQDMPTATESTPTVPVQPEISRVVSLPDLPEQVSLFELLAS